MPIYNYKAKDKEGIIRRGVVEASTVVKASEALHNNGMVVLSLEPETVPFDIDQYIPFLGRVSAKELVLFSRQLSTLINAKVPIIQALEILVQQVSSHKLKSVIQKITYEIEGGKSLSESISAYPNIFSGLYVNLIKAGELSGTIDQALNYLADQQEKDYDLVSKIRGAMTYPIFIITSMLIVGTLMFIFVLPQMISVLQEAGAELPLTTKILIFVTEILQKYWVALLVIFVGVIFGSQIYIKSRGGRLVWDMVKLKLPIFGKLLEKIYMNRFSRNLATLIAGGIPIVTALHTVSGIVGNTVYQQIVEEAAAEVETGKSIASVFADKPEVPVIVSQMIKIGEQTGSLDEILMKLAGFYEKEVENLLNTLTTLIEPVVMILLGLGVAIMVAGILLPIYNLASIQ
ncbi:MAG: type II secretion system F family protein [bacterium]|nr:type II secretion system F family protein [bacterium]